MNTKQSESTEGDVAPTPTDNLVTTQHSIKLGKKTLKYTVTTGTIVLKEESEKKGDKDGEFEGEKPKAEVFFIAYTRDDVKDKTVRPLTFSFNGGPGSSSIWMHLGLLGPRRVVAADTEPAAPPYALQDNKHSLLDVSDLVFIDPVSTGYSRPVTGEKAKAFHGLKKDIESVGDFIRLYTTRYGRWTSPKYLIGESYGTTRASALSEYLQMRHGMYLNGLMLISSVLNFQTLHFAAGNDLPYALFLPTYAATAWYHGKLPKPLQDKPLREVLDEVETFAMRDYTLALMQGSSLSDKERQSIVNKLMRYTGLSKAYLEQTNLRINIHRFVKELLRAERRTVGRLDSRIKGYDPDAAGEQSEFDPSLGTILGPYAGTFNDYIREELGFESDLPYEVLKGLYQDWKWDKDNEYVNVAESLRKAMNLNPHLKIYVANGYFDLATPYFATEYTFNHLGIEPELQENISMGYYDAGHMMYVHEASLKQMKRELAAFVEVSS